MRPRSNISTTLHKKRQASLQKKIFAYFVFILFFISLAILGLTTKEVKINNIIVSGNSAVTSADIINLAEPELNKNYFLIIPADNILLLRKKEIENDILKNINQIKSVNINIEGINKIEIAVTERQASNLWCVGNPTSPGDCYLMDSTGLIFKESPKFSVNAFPEYFGLISDANPIGQYYTQGNFQKISDLFYSLGKMSFQPQFFNALAGDEYEIYIFGGGNILMDNNSDFESQLSNLQALVGNGYIKTDSASLKKINYIDLRFGNKVAFELNK